jgi:hypothetical protein
MAYVGLAVGDNIHRWKICPGEQNSPVNNVPPKIFVEQAKTQPFGFPEAL